MAGKGSRRRPTKVPKEVADANFETIFGKYVPPNLRNRTQENEQPVDHNPTEDNSDE